MSVRAFYLPYFANIFLLAAAAADGFLLIWGLGYYSSDSLSLLSFIDEKLLDDFSNLISVYFFSMLVLVSFGLLDVLFFSSLNYCAISLSSLSSIMSLALALSSRFYLPIDPNITEISF